MNEITQKLKKIYQEIAKEKNKLVFFGLLERVDLDGKWDLLLSADWVRESNNKDNLVYVIKKLKENFGEELEFLAQIVLLTPGESFIKRLGRAISSEGSRSSQEIENLKIGDFIVKKVIIIHSDFSKLDLAESAAGNDGMSVAQLDVASF